MALYVIGDTHFSEGCNKPMDIFGGAWTGYRDKLVESLSVLQPEDVLVLAGDFSWGMSLQEALPDFRLLDSFPGKKLLLKGNHDYWWETLSKLNNFLSENNLKTIKFVHNTCETFGNVAICGTKGYPETEKEPESDEEKKLYNRELERLKNAIANAKKTGAEKIVVMLHYPPGPNTAFARCLQEEKVDFCVFGHLHGKYESAVQGDVRGVEYRLTSCDYLKFDPIFLCEY